MALRFSRTLRWELTPSSLFAKRERPPIVSGATPTLEVVFLALLAHVALGADAVVALREAGMSEEAWRRQLRRFAHRSSDRQRRDSDARS